MFLWHTNSNIKVINHKSKIYLAHVIDRFITYLFLDNGQTVPKKLLRKIFSLKILTIWEKKFKFWTRLFILICAYEVRNVIYCHPCSNRCFDIVFKQKTKKLPDIPQWLKEKST